MSVSYKSVVITMQLINILLVSLLFGQSFAAYTSTFSERFGNCMNKISDLANAINSGFKLIQNIADTNTETLKTLKEPAWNTITSRLAELLDEVMNYFDNFKEQFATSLNKLEDFNKSFPKSNAAVDNAIRPIVNIIKNYQRLIEEGLNRTEIQYNNEISKINVTLTADVEQIKSRLVKINKKYKGDPMIAKLVTSINEKLKECVTNIMAPIQNFYQNTVKLINPGLTQIESVVNEIDECKNFPLEQALKCVDAAKTELPNSEDAKQIVKSMERRIFDTNWKDLFDDSCLVNIAKEIDFLIDGDARKITTFIGSKNNLERASNTKKSTTSIFENSKSALFKNIESIQPSGTLAASLDNIEPTNFGEASNKRGSISSTFPFSYFKRVKDQFATSLNKLKELANSLPENSVAAVNTIKPIMNTITNHQRLIQKLLNRTNIRYNEEMSRISATARPVIEQINSRLAKISKKYEGDPKVPKLIALTNEKLKECVTNMLAPIQKSYRNTIELIIPGLAQIESVIHEIDECTNFPSEEALKCMDAAKTKLPNLADADFKSIKRRMFNTNWKDLFDDSCLVNIKNEIDYLSDEDTGKITKYIDPKTNFGRTSNTKIFNTSMFENSNPAPFNKMKSIPTSDTLGTSLDKIEPINFGEASNKRGSTSSIPEFIEPTPTDNIASMSTNGTPATPFYNIEPTPTNIRKISNINGFTSSTPDFPERTHYNIESMLPHQNVATTFNHYAPTFSDNVDSVSPFVPLLGSINESGVGNVAPIKLDKFEPTISTKRRELNMHPEVLGSILKIIKNTSRKVKIYRTHALELYKGLRNKISSSRKHQTEKELKFLETTFKDAVEPVAAYDAKLQTAAVEINDCNGLQSLDEFMKCAFKIVCNANINEGDKILTAMIDKLNSIIIN